MNLIDPETVYAPLFAYLLTLRTAPPTAPTSAAPFVTVARPVEELGEMQDGALPALFMAVGNTETAWPNYAQDKNLLEAKIFLYAAAGNPDMPADIVLNGLIKVLRNALVPPTGFDMPPALEGLVSWCRIEGLTEVFQNVRSTRAAAIVPVKMLVP